MREDWCQTHVKRIGSYRYKLFSLALHKDWKRGKEAALFTYMSQKKRKYFPKCRTVALKLVLYWKGCKINHNFGFKFQLSNQTLVNSFSITVLFRQPGHKQLNFVHWCLMSGSTSLCVCVWYFITSHESRLCQSPLGSSVSAAALMREETGFVR